MANGKAGELKGRVIGIGAPRVSGDNAQIALIEEYLRYQGAGEGPGQRNEAEAGRQDRLGARNDHAAGGGDYRQGQDARS